MERSRTYLNFSREMYPGHCGYKVTKFDAYVYSVDVVTLLVEIHVSGGARWSKLAYCDLCCSAILLIL